MQTSLCKTCNAEIVWITTPSGKNMPLDAKAETLWVLEDVPVGSVLKAKPLQVRRSHFSTCPDADQHRKKS